MFDIYFLIDRVNSGDTDYLESIAAMCLYHMKPYTDATITLPISSYTTTKLWLSTDDEGICIARLFNQFVTLAQFRA